VSESTSRFQEVPTVIVRLVIFACVRARLRAHVCMRAFVFLYGCKAGVKRTCCNGEVLPRPVLAVARLATSPTTGAASLASNNITVATNTSNLDLSIVLPSICFELPNDQRGFAIGFEFIFVNENVLHRDSQQMCV